MPFVAPIAAAAGSFLSANAGTIALGSLAAQTVGAGVSFFGQRQQAKAAETAANYNAKIARDQSRYESQVSQENALRAQDYGRQVIGAQRAALASSGISGAAGTPLVRLGDTAASIQQEIFDIGQAAALRQRQLIAGADMGTWEARQTASALRTAAPMQLAGSLFNAGTSFLDATGYLAPPKAKPVQ